MKRLSAVAVGAALILGCNGKQMSDEQFRQHVAGVGLTVYALAQSGAEGQVTAHFRMKPGFRLYQGGEADADADVTLAVNVDSSRVKPMDPYALRALADIASTGNVPASRPAVQAPAVMVPPTTNPERSE
jgi:hypothetical protein